MKHKKRRLEYLYERAHFTEFTVTTTRAGYGWEVLDWLDENVGHANYCGIPSRTPWGESTKTTFGFRTLTDATLFKLRWG